MSPIIALSFLFATHTPTTMPGSVQIQKHTFELGKSNFLLDGKPFQIRGGEIHPARIPAEYWRHRIQMVKAMGLNTISCYLFWNYFESEEGKFDFKTGNKNLKQFLQICKEEGMWVLLRPGPYCCAEWELGGIPPYLLRIPDIKLRCMDQRYTKAAERYLAKVAKEATPYYVENGGNILMIQLENEYGSYGNDRNYMLWLRDLWRKLGYKGAFYTADGPTTYMLEAGSVPGAAVGLDSGSHEDHWKLANNMNPGVPVFSSETYPGWLTHWGEKWAKPSVEEIVKEVGWLMDNSKSFCLYVAHGGTNFGFMAGANSGGKGYEPDITSYDYNAPINEQSGVTPKFEALRNLIKGHVEKRGEMVADVPTLIHTITFDKVTLKPKTSIWENLPQPVATPQPRTFEAMKQDYGFMLYRTKLIGHKGGKLTIRDLHDYATVFVDGEYVGNIDRRLGENSIQLPTKSGTPVLDILVEGMGRINFAEFLHDRKGITDRVVLNGMTLMSWEQFSLPFRESWVQSLKPGKANKRPGQFFQATFNLDQTGDTFIDMSEFKKGFVWVNGHNLGRYWEIGPQKRLYCPAGWLKKGQNTVIVFDLHLTESACLTGHRTLE